MRASGLLAFSVAAAALLAAPAFAQSEDEAGDVSEVDKDRTGPLRERVRPVSGHLFLKRGRFEASPSASLSLNDAFFTKYVFGGTIGYFVNEHVGVNLRAGYAVPVISRAAQICTTEATGAGTTRGCRSPTYREVDGHAPGQINWLAGVDATWAPMYGKVGLLAERFLHFDLYALGGVTAIGYRGPSLSNTGAASAPRTAFGGNLGVGSRIVITRWMSLRAELRDLIYFEQISSGSSSLRNQLMFELGFSMFLPTSFIPE